MNGEQFSEIAASLDNRLIVVTAASDHERAGCLVGFHTQCAIDPLRYSVWLSKANHTYRVMLRSDHLGIHFLTAEDRPLAERFGSRTGDDTDKFAGLRVGTGEGGVPVLLDCAHRLEVRRTALLDDGADHVCVITEPLVVTGGSRFRPLLLSEVDDIEPGHGAAERPEPITERAAD